MICRGEIWPSSRWTGRRGPRTRRRHKVRCSPVPFITSSGAAAPRLGTLVPPWAAADQITVAESLTDSETPEPSRLPRRRRQSASAARPESDLVTEWRTRAEFTCRHHLSPARISCRSSGSGCRMQMPSDCCKQSGRFAGPPLRPNRP